MNIQIDKEQNSWLDSSWQRSRFAGLEESVTPEHFRLTNSDLKQRRHDATLLIQAIEQYALPLFDQTLARTHSRLILADTKGVILASWGQEHFAHKLTDIALESGVCWQEEQKGTNAIGTALNNQQLTSIIGNQHFITQHRFLSCTASPIYSATNELLGVLDITSEQQIHTQQITLLVQSMVQQIEAALMNHIPHGSYRFDVALTPNLLQSGWQGVIVTNENGNVLACNPMAKKLLNQNSMIGNNFEPFLPKKWPPEMNQPTTLLTDNQDLIFTCQPLNRSKRTLFSSSTLHLGDNRVEQVWQQACRVINKEIPLLVFGETGTGKEEFIKQLHRCSARKNSPLVAVNCGSLPHDLLESELFGYAAGAFTGANRQGYLGKIRQADGGILFLDEIAEMPLSAQCRLLRVLQEKEVAPVGSNSIVNVDIQIIAATHKDLQQQVELGLFRQDLYYRLNGLAINLPPLRERRDIKALISSLHRKYAPTHQTLSTRLLATLTRYGWPGNLRELDNLMKVTTLLADEKQSLDIDDLPDHLKTQLLDVEPSNLVGDEPEATITLKHSLTTKLVNTFKENQGNISKTARQLGISRNTLYRQLKKLNLK
ncbi:sigma-54-dependent Fis family transcriptional regulator [Aliivibrio kagoshimensis]|uniref:sigma-54-dependent Fis family transcriptional regulator n=1 Tax=Aliivibrio kagoshimensis TaxID=2910230 RepID=UPI003D0CE1B0